MNSESKPTRLPGGALRWDCDAGCMDFANTAEVDPAVGTIGQPTALNALEFGLRFHAAGQNIYVRGLPGTGRMTMVRSLLKRMAPESPGKQDRCYVHNFHRPDRPRLISLPVGEARHFRRRLRAMADFIATGLPKALDAQPISARRTAIQQRVQEQAKKITGPLEAELKRAGMALVQVPAGPVTQTTIFPLVDGKPVPPDQFEQLVAQGKASAETRQQFVDQLPAFQQRLQEVGRKIGEVYQNGAEEVRTTNEQAARDLLERFAMTIREHFPQQAVTTFLKEVIDDVVDTRLHGEGPLPDPAQRYDANIILKHSADARAPIVEENMPTVVNLLGTVEPEWGPEGPVQMDYRGVHPGSLLRADGGFLILDVKDILSEPGAWKALVRTLRTGSLEIVPSELGWMRPYLVLKPEPIPISVKVILVGDPYSYYQLDRLDPDFGELFKILADFDNEIERDANGLQHYAAVLAQIAREEDLLHFDASGVARLVEHGARIASRAGKLTARFGRIADIAREASFLAREDAASHVSAAHVRKAVERTRARASLPSRKFQYLVNNGTIRVETGGAVVGQINGLAVISSGPLTYGFPSRITAAVGPGEGGAINIEEEAELSGSIHTKGFFILGGLMRHLLRTGHPLAFSASIAFEQSYGGIDGDSASGAEVCCLLSALTRVPLRQDLAMTGAIDQHGAVQAIGGVTEKIEGFYDACVKLGLSGTQGVIIPTSNRRDLMLRLDVVESCARGEFHVYSVERIQDALELFTGIECGEPDADGKYPEGSLLGQAMTRLGEYWEASSGGGRQEK